jgi:poly-gamma-glutamate capsule biosynthesis protein CapA/YwtB (metallophosphatase superfamily)
MALLDTPRTRRSANRGLAIAAVVLWAAATALAGFYLWNARETGSAAGQETVGATTALTLPTTANVSTTAGTSSTTTLATTTTTSSTTTTTQPPPLVVAAGGDVLGDRRVGTFMDRNGAEPVFADVKPFLEAAQIAFVNLEGPISDTGSQATWKEYTFRARPALVQGLTSAGIDVVSLANNHSMDYGAAALLDTIARLNEAGVQHAGAGANASAASAPALLISPAGIVAVLAFTDIIPGGFAATAKSPGVSGTTPDRERLLAAVAAAKKKADFVIVSFHWGTEYTGRAGQDQRTLAHQVVDAGADLVLGHHPHVIQGLELYHDRLIAYSLGDFVWDHYSRQTGEAFVLRVTVPREGLPSAELVPVYLDEVTGVPSPVTGDDAEAILTRLARLSADLGLELVLVGDRAYLGAIPESAITTTTP